MGPSRTNAVRGIVSAVATCLAGYFFSMNAAGCGGGGASAAGPGGGAGDPDASSEQGAGQNADGGSDGSDDPSPACRSDLTACGATCTNVLFDENNCGACGAVCPAHCIYGKCLRVEDFENQAGSFCAKMSDGTVRCLWIGGPHPAIPTPSSLAVGYGHACALVGSDMWCWGDNTSGQLGIGSFSNALGAHKLDFAARFVAAGGRHGGTPTTLAHTCAIDPAGKAYCWGNNAYGQLGVGQNDETPREAPTPVHDDFLGEGVGLVFTSISLGAQHTCGIASFTTDPTDRRVFCWGSNSAEQIALGGAAKAWTPQISLSRDVRAVVAGQFLTCVLQLDKTVHCWGAKTVAPSVSKDLPGLSPAEEIALSNGAAHICARRADGKVLCIRSIFADGEVETVPGVDDAKKIHGSCALTAAGRVLCWFWPAGSKTVTAELRRIH